MTTTRDRLRVTQFVTMFESGGTERQFLHLGLALDDRGHDVRFGCIHKSGRLLDELHARQIQIDEYRLRSFYSSRFLRQQVALARALARERVQVLHAYNLYGNVFAIPAARLARVPVVIAAIRDSGVYLTEWTRRVQRAVCRLADHVLVNADAIKEWLVSDGYAADRVSVVRNGIDLSRFRDAPARPANLRQQFNIPDGAPIVATVARLCPSKGFDDLIDAMTIVARAHPDARFLIVGEGLRSEKGDLYADDSYRLALGRRAEALGVGDRVIFAGHRSDIPSILRDVTLVAQPSRTEGLSNSVLESMASGAPVVATPVGGTPEVMTHDRTGWLVPALDPRALGEAISFLLGEPARRRRLGEAARASVREDFSIESMARKTEDVYYSLLDRARGRRRARAA